MSINNFKCDMYNVYCILYMFFVYIWFASVFICTSVVCAVCMCAYERMYVSHELKWKWNSKKRKQHWNKCLKLSLIVRLWLLPGSDFFMKFNFWLRICMHQLEYYVSCNCQSQGFCIDESPTFFLNIYYGIWYKMNISTPLQ